MKTMNLPGFSAESLLCGFENKYHSTQRPEAINGNYVTLQLRPITRCGAACKCCSSDGNDHCCTICAKCKP